MKMLSSEVQYETLYSTPLALFCSLFIEIQSHMVFYSGAELHKTNFVDKAI